MSKSDPPFWAQRLIRWSKGEMPLPSRSRLSPRKLPPGADPRHPMWAAAPRVLPGVYFWGERVTPEVKRHIQGFVTDCLEDLLHWRPSSRLRAAALLGPERWYVQVCARAWPRHDGGLIGVWDTEVRLNTRDVGPSIYDDLLSACRAIQEGKHFYRCVICREFAFDADGRRQACKGRCTQRRNTLSRTRRRRAQQKRVMLEACRKNPQLWAQIAPDKELSSVAALDVDSDDFVIVRRAFIKVERELRGRRRSQKLSA
jgi:hypothetical protein